MSLFIIANTIRLATFTRREEIAIMKMCGATEQAQRGHQHRQQQGRRQHNDYDPLCFFIHIAGPV